MSKLLRLFLTALLLLVAGPVYAANWYVSSVGYSAVTAWTNGTAKAVGNYVRQVSPALNSERVFKATSCSGTCTTAGSEPSWNLTAGATTTDNAGANQIVWTEVTGLESEQVSANWKAPAARIMAFPSGRIASNDFTFVSQDHAETSATSPTIQPATGNIKIVCVNRTGTVPPVTADRCTSATVSATGANSITIGGSTAVTAFYSEGVTFQAGSVGNSGSITLSPGNSGTSPSFIFVNTGLTLNNSNAGSAINFGLTGGTTGVNLITLISPTITFGAAGQNIQYGRVNVEWYGGSLAGTAPTALFSNSLQVALSTSTLNLHGVDLSTLTGSIIAAGLIEDKITVTNSKLNASTTITNGVVNTGKGGFLRVDNSDDIGNGRNYRFAWSVAGAIAQQDALAVRTGGASDGTTPYSWKVVTDSNPILTAPAKLFPMVRRQNTTGSLETSVVEFVSNSTTALTNAQLWYQIEALTTSGVPLSTLSDSRVANVLPSTTATAYTASTQCWDSKAPARQDSHAYNLGDVISVSTNTCRIFYATTAGTSASGIPAGYASAVDGGNTTDGTAVFRAGMRQSMTVTFTPRVAGALFAIPMFAIPSTTINLDPKMSITP